MKRYFYGIIETSGGIDTFIFRKRKSVPINAIKTLECRVATREEVNVLAYELRVEFMRTNTITPGDVCIYADDEGQHTAIVLHTMEYQSYFVFVTSNPYWGRTSRAITKEEQSLMGFPDKGRTSYFTPVIRDNEFAVPTGIKYPTHRIANLIIEFYED